MSARLHILTLFLLAGCLSARGQDLRTGIALDSQFLAAGEYLAWLDEDGNILRTRPLERTLTALVESGGHLYALDEEGRGLIALTQDGHITGQESLPVQGRLCGLAAEKMSFGPLRMPGKSCTEAPVPVGKYWTSTPNIRGITRR